MAGRHPGCLLCGHQCRADRAGGELGRCRAGTLVGVSSAVLHDGEEPPLSGTGGHGGSGAIFLTRCNLSCAFCQNHQISQGNQDPRLDVGVDGLVEIMFRLKEAGAVNVNIVSPTPYAVELAQALALAKSRGLGLPVVYNTGGYDSPVALALMEGLVDVYLPDAKLGLAEGLSAEEPDPRSMRLFGTGDYVKWNRAALTEMHRQVGRLTLDGRGLATRGLLVRHLVLPDDLARTKALLPWLAGNLGRDLHLSLMAQYHPSNKLSVGDNPEYRDLPGLGRPLSTREYEECVDLAWSLGLRETFVQDLEAAFRYRPDFAKPGVFDS